MPDTHVAPPSLPALLDAFNAHDGKISRKDSFWKIVE
jgi:hypothetical protein